MTDVASVWSTEYTEETLKLSVSLRSLSQCLRSCLSAVVLVVTTHVCLETDVCLEIYRGLCPKTQVSWREFILSWVSVCVSRDQVHTIQLPG